MHQEKKSKRKGKAQLYLKNLPYDYDAQSCHQMKQNDTTLLASLSVKDHEDQKGKTRKKQNKRNGHHFLNIQCLALIDQYIT